MPAKDLRHIYLPLREPDGLALAADLASAWLAGLAVAPTCKRAIAVLLGLGGARQAEPLTPTGETASTPPLWLFDVAAAHGLLPGPHRPTVIVDIVFGADERTLAAAVDAQASAGGGGLTRFARLALRVHLDRIGMTGGRLPPGFQPDRHADAIARWRVMVARSADLASGRRRRPDVWRAALRRVLARHPGIRPTPASIEAALAAVDAALTGPSRSGPAADTAS